MKTEEYFNKSHFSASDGAFIVKIMKQYAKQKCEEQRHECQIERNKRSLQLNGVWYVACEDVLNAPEPNFD